MPEHWASAAADGALPEHHSYCFGCGSQNPAGMNAELRLEEGVVVAEVTYDRRHEGAPGIVHGGVLAALFDEVLGTVPLTAGVPVVTGYLNVRYSRPAIIHTPLTLRARSTSTERRKWFISGTLTDGDQTLGTADGLWIAVDAVHFDRAVPPTRPAPATTPRLHDSTARGTGPAGTTGLAHAPFCPERPR